MTDIRIIEVGIQGPPGVSNAFGHRAATTAALNYGYFGGIIRSDNVPVTVAASVVALAANQLNYVECSGAGTVSANIIGFTAGQFPMATVLTGAASITTITDKRGFAAIGGGAPVSGATPDFTSAQIALTLNANHSAAHGLGSIPRRAEIVFQCVTGENGYSVGDEIRQVNTSASNGTDAIGVGAYADAANVGFQIYQQLTTNHKSNGGPVGMTLANWRARIRAWL